MQFKLLVSKYTATKQLIYSCLQESLSVYTYKQETLCIKDAKFPLYKGRDKKRILYISGIALRLEKSQNQKALEIANAIASSLSEFCGDVFNIDIVSPGWIHFKLTHPTLAAWLQNLAMGCLGGREIEKSENLPIENSGHLFAVQYAHARCCSLLQQAHREGLIKLKDVLSDTQKNIDLQKLSLSNSVSAFWSVIFPNPIPWLDSDQKLRLHHPAEGRLISELVQVVDDLECHAINSTVNWQKAALNLSQAFDNFWSECRIWGKVKITSPQLAQARLGLVMITQSVFRVLLEEKLGMFAPLEL
ncbi:MAG: DALR anticodon-binding domain-containing protein [Aulosira sp. DedQUE10]|nr:DALR anticodon-binding domain-containing protein [Aulosira sp. DedQUE10]